MNASEAKAFLIITAALCAVMVMSSAQYLQLIAMISLAHVLNPAAGRKRKRRSGGLWDLMRCDMSPAAKDEIYHKAFRMGVVHFNGLVNMLNPYIHHSSLEPGRFIGIVLFRFSQNASTWVVADEFQVCEATVTNSTAEFVNIMTCPAVCCTLMVFPEGQALCDTMHDFREWCGLPNVAGAADGKVFRLAQAPRATNKPADYWAVRHKSKACYGINALGICDSKGRFIYAFVKYPGRVHDSTVFTSSSLFHDLSRGVVWGGVSIGFKPCLVVDSAYPLLPFTLKRYNTTRHHGTPSQVSFDKAVARGRNPIERAWGHLVSRFHICNNIPVKDLSMAPGIITACMLLHNFCERFDPMCFDDTADVYEDEDEDDQTYEASVYPSDVAMRASGMAQRDALCSWFAQRA